MKFIPAIFFALLLQVSALSQSVIRGRVVASSNGSPIPGCSVFITNTSRGTTADANGQFELTGIPPGKHDLVVSSVGYETIVYSFSESQLPLQLRFEMDIKAKEMANLVLEESVEEGWEKWGVTFMENFIGTVPNAKLCRIKNEKSIRFRYYKKSNRVIAYCDEPLQIENKALGYTIRYQLENFEVNFKIGSISYLGYSLYEPMEAGNGNKQRKWMEKRKEAFYGSVMHFMRCLYHDSLAQAGFVVTRMQREPNTEKQRVRAVYGKKVMLLGENNNNGGRVVIGSNPAVETPGDSSKYYTSVMRQPDYLDRYDTAVLTADSIIGGVSGDVKLISFENFLFVTYNKAKEEEEYVRLQYPVRKASVQRSWVQLSGSMVVALDMNGNYFDPQEFVTTGYWGWREKMANSLPQDFDPGESQ
ncbi:MAG: carboxypeptidase-like regulatory domain-containing protein [Chitinophagaceae bacterium]|nr:carboxypeptidase-like regulatory domain-containing protein [Chitinophagaceae bacterium]